MEEFVLDRKGVEANAVLLVSGGTEIWIARVTEDTLMEGQDLVEIEWLKPKLKEGRIRCKSYTKIQLAPIWWDCIMFDITNQCERNGDVISFEKHVLLEAKKHLGDTSEEVSDEDVKLMLKKKRENAEDNLSRCAEAKRLVMCSSQYQHLNLITTLNRS
jgi:hypothetical protein